MRHNSTCLTALLALAFCATTASAEQIPREIIAVIRNACGDCHVGNASEGGLSIRLRDIDWSSSETITTWEDIHQYVSHGVMPPHDADPLSKEDRDKLLNWLDQSLIKYGPIGGTPLRRLNRREYANTIEQIFGITNYKVSESFPADSVANGFDNQGEALVVAGSHLEALVAAATEVADQIFPPPARIVPPASTNLKPKDLVISYSSACVVDGAMRLASSGNGITRHATWPSRFEAPVAGVYRVSLDASTFNPPAETPQLTVARMRMSDRGDVQTLKVIDVDSPSPKNWQFDVELNRGDTVVMRYSNGPYDYDANDRFKSFVKEAFMQQPALAAAWDAVGTPARGGNGWLRLKEAMADESLNRNKFVDNEKALDKLVKRVTGNKVRSGETLVYKYFEEGPNIGIHAMKIHGPISRIRDREEIRSENLRRKLFGDSFDHNSPASVKQFLTGFLAKLFRRPATAREIDRYADLIAKESAATGSDHAGMHLAVRTALLSPAFLYRSVGSGKMDQFELASRLSYFLRSSAPDATLSRIAADGKLDNAEVLKREVKRLINKEFAIDFTRQWLGLDKLESLMPDPRLGKFSEKHKQAIYNEVHATFFHIWNKNYSVTDLVAPTYVFTNPQVGWDIYRLEQFNPQTTRLNKKDRFRIKRREVPRDGPHGGLLGMSAVMMATANGVDTQPVLRGVWLLENVFGMPTPEPPDAVPALTPDVNSSATVKERLAQHMASESCAVCHKSIDPLGFALESFDPLGQWREHYPKYVERDGKTKKQKGQEVDTTGVLPDGTKIKDVRDLKQWLVNNPEVFARCFSEKLLTYATGRRMSYRERSLIAKIVEEQLQNNLRIQNLVCALVDSEIFKTK